MQDQPTAMSKSLISLALLLLLLLLGVVGLAEAQCEEEQCLLLSSDAEKTPFATFEEAELYGRCAARCTLEVLGSGHRRVVLVNDNWRSLRISGLGKIYKLWQCTTGCSVAPSFSDSKSCRDRCLELCENSKRPYFAESSPTQCRKQQCLTGCDVYHTIEDTVLPTPPISFDVSQASILAGLFDMTASANTSELPAATDISAYIFSIDNGNETFYVVHWSLTEMVDLSYFSCQTVNISLSVVNRNGSSQFTPPLSVCVHGGPPSSPANFKTEFIVDDLRPGFYGHAVIGLQWETPEGAELLTGYELEMTPFSPVGSTNFCGKPVKFQIDKNATSYEVRAETPTEYLRFGVNADSTCSYQFRLASLPGNMKSSARTVKFRDVLVTSPTPPVIDFTCFSTADEVTGFHSIHAEFTYNNQPLTQEAIYKFVISLRNTNLSVAGLINAPREDLEAGNAVSGYFRQISERFVFFCEEIAPFFVELTENGENITGVANITSLCPQEDITLRFRTAINETEGAWWRPVPDHVDCLVSVPIVPPGPVLRESVRLSGAVPLERSLAEDGESKTVRVSISWDPPPDPYGKIQRYDVYIGQNLLQGTEPTNFLFATEGNETSVDVEYTIPSNPRVCLFLQIRSLGEFGEFTFSNWSEPFFAPIEDGYTLSECDPTNIDKQSSLKLIAGVIVLSIAVFLLLLLLITLCLLFYFKPKCYCLRRKSIHQDSEGISEWPNHYPKLPPTTAGSAVIDGPVGNGWEIPKEYLVREYQLGEGSFGKVAKGFIRGPVPGTYSMNDRIHASVAMKFLKDSPSEQEKQDFAKEIELMKRIGFAKHAHVVGLFGVVTVPEPICILLEYLEYGDLLSYLQDIREEVNRLKQKDSQREVSVVTLPATSTYTNLGDVEPDNLLSFAFQIASGMEFLGGLGVIHRDLACRNVLVGDKKILKISDFGLSREGDTYVKSGSGRLPYKWMALESLGEREFTSQSDVWAYGVVLWEIATLGQFPYPSIANEDMLSHISEGNRLEQPSNCSDEVYEVMKLCWSSQPSQRPTFSEAKEKFETMLLETTSYLQFTSLTSSSNGGVNEAAEVVFNEEMLESATIIESSPRHFSEGKEDLVLSNGGAGASELPSDSEDEETDV